jgi:hypothetical protein
MNKKNQDQFLAQLIRNDRVGEPDKAIEDRLIYSFLLKNNHTKVRQNSFSNFFGWLFSFQGMGLKTGLISAVLFFSLMNNQFSFEPSKISGIDSTLNQRILLADTAHYIQTVDSLRKDSLN